MRWQPGRPLTRGPTPPARRPRAASPRNGARCPTSPGCTCSGTSAAGSCTSARPSRSASASPRTSPKRRACGRQPRARRDGRVASRRSSAWSSPREAEALLSRAGVHQAVPPAFQHPAARRQVLSVHRDLPRRAVSARVLHPRAPPPRPRLLRPVLQRQARARDAGGAGEGVHVPLLHRSRARPAQRQPVPGLLHQALHRALRRLRLARGLPRGHRPGDGLPVRAVRRDRARPAGAHARGRRGRGVRAGHPGAQPPARRALAAGAPSRRQRRRPARSTRWPWRSTGATPTRRCFRSATACSPTGSRSIWPTRPSAASRTWPRSSCCSTTPATCRSRR